MNNRYVKKKHLIRYSSSSLALVDKVDLTPSSKDKST